jgi:DNA-binding transcriptional LysR family regulator
MSFHLDLKRMRYVLAVARTESITAAAWMIGLTQSALSRSLVEVEEGLGVLLFERLPRGMRLTPAGERFVANAKRIIGDADAMLAEVRSISGEVVGPLRVGVAPRGYIAHARRALVGFAVSYPEVDIEVVTGSVQSLCPRLVNGELDLLVGSSALLRRWRDIKIRPIARFRFAVIVRPGHPLTSLGRPPLEIEVLQYPMLMMESVEAMTSDVALRFAHYGLPSFHPRYVMEDPWAIGQLLLRSDVVLPMNSRDFSEVSPNLTLLYDALVMPENHMALALASTRTPSAAALRFSAMLEEVLAEDNTTSKGSV